ncbi:MAG: hypothetical protein LBF77_10645 [Spirochaetaceae bacterium]|nr:hypothetical protein [Spirochaetaceae bacterium]
MKRALFFCCILFMFSAFTVYSQTGQEDVKVTTAPITPTSPKEKPEFPQWALDLRRFDIILFGSFPFTYWFASTGMDLYRSSQHNWDTRYAPWPVKSAGAVNMTNDEYMITLSCAVGGSILAALVDHIIVRIKRNKAARKAAAITPGEAIITRTPISPETEAGDNGAETGGSVDGGAADDDADPASPPLTQTEASPPAAPTEASPPLIQTEAF